MNYPYPLRSPVTQAINNPFVLSTFSALFAALLLIALARPSQAQESIVSNPDVVLHVKGMMCELCAERMTKGLKTLDAVDKVQVFLEDQKVFLTLTGATLVTDAQLREVVEDYGFTTESVEFVEAKSAREPRSSEDMPQEVPDSGAASSDVATPQIVNGIQTHNITADINGFAPARLELLANVPATLIFTRKGEAHCIQKIQIPEFGIELTELPLNEPVAISFTPTVAGSFAFACGMDMISGTILVKS